MQRYFINSDVLSIDETVVITGDDFHHIKNVMRMKVNDKVFLSTNNNDSYIGVISNITNDSIEITVCEILENKTELNSFVVIAQGLVRREKTEEVLRRITELGASGYIQVEMDRSVVKVKDYSKNDKLDRMNKIVKEASEQSHRNKIPVVYPLVNIKNFIEQFKDYDVKIFAYEESGRSNDKSLKSLIKLGQDKKMVVLVGPEGGFSEKEVKMLLNSGFNSVGLGPRILRTETAPLYIMSAISYELELN